jgi:hypothetical protein
MPRSLIARLLALLSVAGVMLAYEAPPAAGASNPPVVVIVMENHSYASTDPGVSGSQSKYVVGNANAPYINNTLIPSGTLYSNYTAYAQSSFPNYLVLTSGSATGCPRNACAPDNDPNENIFHLMGQAGIPFASLQESMPTPCALTNTDRYKSGHNPEVYYTNIDAKTALPYNCPATDLPVTPAPVGTPDAWPTPLPAFSLITPDSCNNMHGSGSTGPCPNSGSLQLLKNGDTWLSANVPPLLAQGAIVIVTFDEGTENDTTGVGGHVMTVVTGPGVPAGVVDATPMTHFGLLAGLLNFFELSPLLGGSATATPLVIPRSTTYATPTISAIAPESGLMGSAVSITGTDLTTAYRVTFGGVAARFTVDSDMSITATVPLGAVDGPVSVSTVGGVAASPTTFTVTGGPPLPAIVQSAVASGKSTLTASAAWPQATAAGDLQVATLGWYGSGTPTTPSGWTRAVSSGSVAVFYRQNAPATSGSVSIPFSASVNWVLSLSEWSGVATSGALDKIAKATSDTAIGTTATTGTTAATAQPVEVAVGAIRAVGTVAQSAPTNGFTLLNFGAAPNDSFGVYRLVTTAIGPQWTSVTLSSAVKWRGVLVTFRGA